jgi:hypothetical protein
MNNTTEDMNLSKFNQVLKETPLETRLFIYLQMDDYDNWSNGEYKGDNVKIKEKVTHIIGILKLFNEDSASLHSLPTQGGVRLPNDEEVKDWYSGNIDADCSASSAIYKFRLWLKSLPSNAPEERKRIAGEENRCEYELIVEKFFGYKMTKEDKPFTVNDTQLTNLVCFAMQDFIPFVMYLTGYKEEQANRIYNNWKNNVK